MGIKQPRLCMGIVVSDTCTINVLDGTAASRAITIPFGTYWLDPKFSGIVASGTLDALGIFAQLIDTADTGGTYTCAYSSAASGDMNGWAGRITRSAGTFQIRGSNAGTNTSGRRFLRFLGYNSLADLTAGINQDTKLGPALWDTLRGENGSPQESPKGYGVTVETEGGVVFTADLGDPLQSRLVSFPALSAIAVKRRSDSYVAALGTWVNFESTMWPWLTSGMPIRYWSDKNATQNTYLAAAITATDGSFTTPVVSTYADNTMICVDGEWMLATAGTGTTTTTVYRDKPVAHGKYAPVSTDDVATYVLAADGGNVNQSGFKPERRSEGDDRWDMALSLTRTTGV